MLAVGKRAAMYAVSLATQKGGSGKSTLAIGLAVAAMENGQHVGIIEADTQGTISKWGQRRNKPEPRIERVGNQEEIERTLLRLRQDGFTLAMIDCAATDNELSRSAIGAANLCLIPARPSPADIEAALPTLSAVRRLHKPFAFVLNQTPARSFRIAEAAIALNSAGLLALPYIVQRNDHQDALGSGAGVTEYFPNGKAAAEIRDLWRWVWNKLTEEPISHERTAVRAAG
jgi:chromosome partitioning protein